MFARSCLLGCVCWVRLAGSGLLGQVCRVRFAWLSLLGQICWARFAGLGMLGVIYKAVVFWVWFTKEVHLNLGNLDNLPDGMTD